jgi:hypothetical protein
MWPRLIPCGATCLLAKTISYMLQTPICSVTQTFSMRSGVVQAELCPLLSLQTTRTTCQHLPARTSSLYADKKRACPIGWSDGLHPRPEAVSVTNQVPSHHGTLVKCGWWGEHLRLATWRQWCRRLAEVLAESDWYSAGPVEVAQNKAAKPTERTVPRTFRHRIFRHFPQLLREMPRNN